jgi:hypothetical protein
MGGLGTRDRGSGEHREQALGQHPLAGRGGGEAQWVGALLTWQHMESCNSGLAHTSPTCLVAAQNWRWRKSTRIWTPTAAGRQEEEGKGRHVFWGGGGGREETVREENRSKLEREEVRQQAPRGKIAPGWRSGWS